MEQLARIHLQTVELAGGGRIRGLTELGPQQKELFAAIGAPIPVQADFAAEPVPKEQGELHL